MDLTTEEKYAAVIIVAGFFAMLFYLGVLP